jgi:hypothetical protein
MKIFGIEIDGVRYMQFNESQNPTWFFRCFMDYCIDRHLPQITMDERFNDYFSPSPVDPIFGRAIGTSQLSEHNLIYYSTNSGTPQKIGIMVHLANLLDMEFRVFTI